MHAVLYESLWLCFTILNTVIIWLEYDKFECDNTKKNMQ